jgi:ABC-2 type transport system ATP-binding protein
MAVTMSVGESNRSATEETDGVTADPTATTIVTEHLSRRFGDVLAVQQVDLRVARGEIFGLLGPNGAGKTTLVKMLTTMLPPTSGNARVSGFDVLREPRQVRRRIGYVPQMLSADGALTGHENLLLSARLYGIPRSDRPRRIAEALDFMGLSGSARRLVREYSGGMIRRLEIAQSMLHQPDVLFLDEPTVGLDPVARHAVWDRVRSLRDQFRTTVLLTTHDMDEADALCERVAIMHRGIFAVIGSTEDLKSAIGADATLDDVFIHFTGDTLDERNSFRETERARATARRSS